MAGTANPLSRWRMHIAALVALLLVLGIAAVGGTTKRPVSVTAADQSASAPTDSSAASSTQAQATNATAAPTSGSATAATGGAQQQSMAKQSGAPLSSQAAKPSTPVTYDDGANDQEVRIGGSTFTSGPAATYGEQIAVGFAAGVNYVNEHGGINGRKLTLKIYDDGADPAKQLANTKRLVEVDHVFALSMVYAPQTGAYVASKGIPVFHEGQFNDEFTNPWWFPLGGPQLTTASGLAWYGARTLGVKTVSIFYLDAGSNNFSSAFADKVAEYWKGFGVEVKAKVAFAPDQTSCSQGISEATADKPDFIDFEIDASKVIECGVEAQVQGYKPPKCWGGYLIGVPVIHEALGDYSRCMYAFDAFGDDYQNQDYVNEVKRVSSKTDTYSSVTIAYYIAAILARDSMDQLGTQFTRVHLRDVLNTFKDWTPKMTTSANQPRWTWTPDCHFGIEGGYLIQIPLQGELKWTQITPQFDSTPLPPGTAPPPDFAKCPRFRQG